MELRVVKTGADMFDVLHATGLGTLVAEATATSVTLMDAGTSYRLVCHVDAVPNVPLAFLNHVLSLPSNHCVGASRSLLQTPDTSLANLDGLLAARFTSRGARIPSVAALLLKEEFVAGSIAHALQKVSKEIDRWAVILQKKARRSGNWIADVLADYARSAPVLPTVTVPTNKHDINILMTLEPAFSYARRQAIDDGLLTDRKNVTIRGTTYAPLLAFIGAARWLRAQPVKGNLVNFYVVMPTSMTLSPDASMPLLRPVDHAPAHAVALEWLQVHRLAPRYAAEWNCLAYQVIQTQGHLQPISSDRGAVDLRWLRQRTASKPWLMDNWVALLRQRQEECPIEVDDLVECLLHRRPRAWLAHLRDVALYLTVRPEDNVRSYHIGELREITSVMTTPSDMPLSTILERNQGTLRYGRALRQIGQLNSSVLADLVDALDGIHTRHQLMGVLNDVLQACELTSAKSPFAIVPTVQDLKYLLDDVDTHGAPTIARLLIVLAKSRYSTVRAVQDGTELLVPSTEDAPGEFENDNEG